MVFRRFDPLLFIIPSWERVMFAIACRRMLSCCSNQSAQRVSFVRGRLFTAVVYALPVLFGLLGPAAATALAAGNVTAVYAAGNLTLTGDNSDNLVTMSVTAGVLTLTGQSGTTVNGLASVSTPLIGPLTAAINMGGGNDTLTINNVTLVAPSVLMGSGNDTFIITNSNLTITTYSGGTGSNRFRMSNSSLRIKNFS